MNIREMRIYDEIQTFTRKTKKMSHYLRALLCVPIGVLIPCWRKFVTCAFTPCTAINK